MMKRGIIQAGLVFAVVLSIFWPLGASAGMRVMADEELEAIDGQAFATFRIENRTTPHVHQVAVLLLDTRITAQVSFADFKLGHRTSHAGLGWDVDMRNVRFGTAAEPLVLDGLRLEFGFLNITDPALRDLQFVKIGSDRASGAIEHRLGYPTTGFLEHMSTDVRSTGRGLFGIEDTVPINAHRVTHGTHWLMGNIYFRNMQRIRLGTETVGSVTPMWFAVADVLNTIALLPHTDNTFPGRGFWIHMRDVWAGDL